MTHRRFVVFSDLDGTLLDHDTYRFDAAQPALDRLEREDVPLVLCSSKTRSEIEALRDQLGNRHPFISENGGGIFIPEGYFPFAVEGTESRDGLLVIPVGAPYDELVAALAIAASRTGVRVRGFAQMSDAEVAQATGLPLADARRARARDFDEPFEILDRDRAPALLAAIRATGRHWTSGGRFHHILGSSDKGAAARRLTSLYDRALGPVTTVGLGDAPNDAPLLQAVDLPIAVRSPRVAALQALVPGAMVTESPGPAGWNEAVLRVLDAPRG